MPIQDNTDWNAIDAYIEAQIQYLERAVIRQFQIAGETAINIARNNRVKTFQDQTGNLRSSIGYVISVDGEIITQSAFEVVLKGGQGAKEGKEFAEQLARQFPDKIALIVVAGKNYAIHVSNRGYDVIDRAEIEVEKLIPKLLDQLNL